MVMVESSLRGAYGCALFFEGGALQGLEFGEGCFEFAGDLLLRVFLRWLDSREFKD